MSRTVGASNTDRQQVLKDYVAAIEALDDDANAARAAEIEEAYLASLQPVPISRCPYFDVPVEVSIDTAGLDGLWWYCDRPVRPADLVTPTWFAFTGAMKLASTVENTPFSVRPGPGVPFVLPLLLPHPDMVAVISQVRVGKHTGYPVIYYCSNAPAVQRFNDWGSSSYSFMGPERWQTGWLDEDETAQELDFDLEPWVASEKLLWIPPDNPGLELHAGVEGCPYLGLKDTQDWPVVRGGKVLK